MPNFRPSPDLDMHYEIDNFTDPWTRPQTVLMLHGNAESGLAWWGWVPTLARHYRVVRPDMRGFGQSTPMPRDYHWTLDRLVEDFCLLMDHLGIERFHLVGAKIGGTIARAFAARRPERVMTLTVVGTPPPLRVGAAEKVPELIREFETHGVEHWARENMGNRLGSDSRRRVSNGGRSSWATPRFPLNSASWARSPAPTSAPIFRRSGARRWSSPPSRAGSARSRKCVPGSSRYRIPNCWFCPATLTMLRPHMRIVRRTQHWIS
jgi:pimeloyl-ACP methyl ester carboxylesterase